VKCLYHVRHCCGHGAYWEHPDAGYLTAFYPCPWCGGESGQRPAHGEQSSVPVIDFGAPIGRVYRQVSDCPIEPVRVYQQVGDACCRDAAKEGAMR
jgi:hypothetical protein